MKHVPLLVIVCLAYCGDVAAQSHPDLSGTWVSDQAKNAAMIEKGFAAQFGRLTVALSDNAATFVEWAGASEDEAAQRGLPGMKTVCNFGPTPAVNVRPMRPETCSTKWDGTSLVTTTTVARIGSFPGRVVTAAYSLEGGQLKIASSWVGEMRFEAVTFWSKAK